MVVRQETVSENQDDAPGIGSQVPRGLAQHRVWDVDTSAHNTSRTKMATPSAGVAANAELVLAVAHLGGSNPALKVSAVANLCAALRTGGHDLAEVACDLGAVEAATQVVFESSTSNGAPYHSAVVQGATEALWFLCDDSDSCGRLVERSGNTALLRLLHERGPEDGTVAASTLRLLTSTLYAEGRKSRFWQEAHADVFVEALGWALALDAAVPADCNESIVGLACDVAALWVLRAGSTAGADSAKALMAVVPQLLRRMEAGQDNAYLQQHACRFLWALSKICCSWPENIQQPALVALTQMAFPLQLSFNPDVRAYSGLAVEALAMLASQNGAEVAATGLSSMD